MYSVVLMMAMTSGGDVADFGHRHGGCCGGESYSSCSGSYGYSSCCGGGGHQHHRHHRGGCCGGESYGCYGGGYSSGCSGYSVAADCGCGAAVYTGCAGGVVTGGAGGDVNANKGKPGATDEVKTTAEEKKWLHELIEANPDKKADLEKFWNDPRTSHKERKETYDAQKGDKKDDNKPEDKKSDKKDKKPGETLVPAPATIIVSLPANATLTIDDAATTSTDSTRVFTSPVLPAGREFHYTLKAQMVRDGKSVVVSKEVTVRAGETTHATMEAGLANVANR